MEPVEPETEMQHETIDISPPPMIKQEIDTSNSEYKDQYGAEGMVNPVSIKFCYLHVHVQKKVVGRFRSSFSKMIFSREFTILE